MDDINFSVCPLEFIRISDDGEQIASSIATGFVWESNAEWFIITNWHNVTGINPQTNTMLGEFIPNAMRVGIKILEDSNPKHLLVKHEVRTIDLYNGD